ncbi:hypothetical protein N7468_000160 [Penicillium chermesinum]|uniref:Peptidase S54 rhomboid domain-containing protein n=1 Tax=Penicillium chermesinum TaxID=63820 RepID=A0A9W9PMS1_9EURO|nr:uncharacterized protein N7468_000160 [Penicillium chermesinum]KAJ5248709.1 hypothetical protein N7468_000160 [Penicillium chermesinum]
MSNPLWVAWRTTCSGVRPSVFASLRPAHGLRIATGSLDNILRRPFSALNPIPQAQHRPVLSSPFTKHTTPASLWSRSKRTTAKPSGSSRSTPSVKALSSAEIKAIFKSPDISAAVGNRTLEVLQKQRIEGTIDQDLPADLASRITESQAENALAWLRAKYPVDEDAAILARFEREEREEEQKLVRRAEALGLYKPQSGSYDAELGEDQSPYGKSSLKEYRELNEKRLLAEQERKRQEWLASEEQSKEEMMRQIGQNKSLEVYKDQYLAEARPRADPSVRPYLAWVQKHHIAATANDPDAVNLSSAQRLLPSLAFGLLVFGLCFYFAQTYQPPAREDRLWPNVPPAMATAGAIIGANVAVTLAWRFLPPAWKWLNRFFVIVPFYPRALSMLGATFSHQSWNHLAWNMLGVGLVTVPLHDKIGRGNLVGIYVASGVAGSLLSLSRSVILGTLGLSSLGASGAVCGVVGAMCMINPNSRFTLWFIPPTLSDTLWLSGSTLLVCLVGMEVMGVMGLLRLFNFGRKMDFAAHLGGFAVGIPSGYYLRKRAQERRKARNWPF